MSVGQMSHWTLFLKEMKDVELSCWHFNSMLCSKYYKIETCAGVFDPSRSMAAVEFKILSCIVHVEGQGEKQSKIPCYVQGCTLVSSWYCLAFQLWYVTFRETDLQIVIRPC